MPGAYVSDVLELLLIAGGAIGGSVIARVTDVLDLGRLDKLPQD
jgi:hypothetical protein